MSFENPSLDTYIEIFAGVILSAVLGSLLYKSSQRAAKRIGSRFVLRYGWALRGLTLTTLLMMCSGLLFAKFDTKSPDEAGLLVCTGILTALFLFFFIEAFFVRIEFDVTTIYTFTPWRSHREIPWSDIISFRHYEHHNWYVIQTRTHGTLRVSTFLTGINNFVTTLRNNATVFNYQETKPK